MASILGLFRWRGIQRELSAVLHTINITVDCLGPLACENFDMIRENIDITRPES
jgi:hypothetical protein